MDTIDLHAISVLQKLYISVSNAQATDITFKLRKKKKILPSEMRQTLRQVTHSPRK